MGANTKIEWTATMMADGTALPGFTFNPWRGCTKIAPGCANCYADAQSKRNPAVIGVWGPNGTRVVAAEAQWRAVERWNREAAKAGVRRRVFCASLADVFEDWQGPMTDSRGNVLMTDADGWFPAVPMNADACSADARTYHARPLTMDDVRARLFRLIDSCQSLDFLLLTKRPENVRKFWPIDADRVTGSADAGLALRYLQNVWLLTSVSDQQTVDTAIPELLKCRDLCPVLGISAEPLLGPIALTHTGIIPECGDHPALRGYSCFPDDGKSVLYAKKEDALRESIDWVIVGGESGPNARPCNVEWIRSIVRQCRDAGVRCFVKQLGASVQIRESTPAEYMAATHAEMEWPEGTGFRGTRVLLRDPKGGDPTEWPEDLRVREVPDVLR